jgi:hypothetical protein
MWLLLKKIKSLHPRSASTYICRPGFSPGPNLFPRPGLQQTWIPPGATLVVVHGDR